MNIPGKPFTDTLGEVEGGRLLRELTEELYNVMACVMDTRKPGSVAVKIDIIPTGRGTVELKATPSFKKPEHDRPSTTFFVAPDLSLTRRDPNQPDLPLREVDAPRNAPVAVND